MTRNILAFICFTAVLGQVSSQESASVSLFQEVDFKGSQIDRRITSCYNVPGNFERKAKSIRLTQGSCVVIYDDCGCLGGKVEIRGNTQDLGGFKNKLISLSPCGSWSKYPQVLIENWRSLGDNSHDGRALNRVFRQGDVAVYFDKVKPGTNWMFSYLTRAWSYVKRNYGSFGDGEKGLLGAVFHADASNGVNNPMFGLGCDGAYRHGLHLMRHGADAWTQAQSNSQLPRSDVDVHLVTHELAHVVEFNAYNVLGSPAISVWKDSKWAEIFNYDVYLNLGFRDLANRWRDEMLRNKDKSPRDGTYWFRDWFLPLYENYGRGPLLARFLRALSQNLPKHRTAVAEVYAKNLNLGEFVHFWSGAANKNLKDLATKAFGWTAETNQQFENARKEFRNVRYSN